MGNERGKDRKEDRKSSANYFLPPVQKPDLSATSTLGGRQKLKSDSVDKIRALLLQAEREYGITTLFPRSVATG